MKQMVITEMAFQLFQTVESYEMPPKESIAFKSTSMAKESRGPGDAASG